MSQRARGIQSIEVSGRILHALVQAGAPMMLKDIARAADLAPAQCHAYLTSLRHVGLVHQDPITGLYRTGSLALRLGIAWMKGTPLAATAIEKLKTLTEELGVMSLLAIWTAAGPTIIHLHAGITQTALNIRQGTLFSVTGTATGRVFAAFGGSPEIETRIETELGEGKRHDGIGGLLTRDAFERARSATRDHGFAAAAGTPVPGLNAVAAPVFGSGGELAFVVALIAPGDELPVTKGAVAVERLRQIAGSLSGARPAQEPVSARSTGCAV